MKIDIKTLKDTFKFGYEAYEESRDEALKVIDYFHNRQYQDWQLAELANRGQPPETFNVIKLFARMLLGYYSTVVNTVKVTPKQENDIMTASILNDLVSYTFRTNNFINEADKIKLEGILVGLMASYQDVVETGETDEYGRPKYEIRTNHVPALELVLDPMSRLDDYSDARYIHRFKWVTSEVAIKLFGKAKVDELDSYFNHLNIDEAEFTQTYNVEFHGNYRVFDNYLIVHTIMEDDNGDTWAIYWCGEKILDKKKITYKEVKFPYRIQRLHPSNKTEFYGIFREVMSSQDAINQALIKLQLLVNTNKVLVEGDSVEDLDEFERAYNRVTGVIPVNNLQGIRFENTSKDVQDQYIIIDKALDRIQRLLSINDSFLGMAYASDSGAKVKLQQNASVIALRYLTAKIEQFYRLLGWDIVNLIKQYYTSHDVIRVADEYEGNKWVEINKPAEVPIKDIMGRPQINPQTGLPLTRNVFEEVRDPASNKPMVDSEGRIIMAPIPTAETEIAFTKADIEIASIAYNDEDEKTQMVLEQFINGPLGTMLSQVDPAGYFAAGRLAVKNTRTKYSGELASILDAASQKLQQNPMMQQQMQQGQLGGQMSQSQAVNQLSGRA